MKLRNAIPLRILAVVLTLGLVAAACGGDGDESSSPQDNGGTESPAVTDPDDSGSEDISDDDLDLDAYLNVTNDGAPATTLDPHAEPTQGVTPYWTPLYDTLTDIAIAGELRPRLAESWEFSDDGLNLVLQIREGVTFHDGTPLDAEAVKLNLDRARGSEISTQKNQLSSVSEVTVTGPMEVTVTTEHYDAALPWILGTAAGAIINPKAIEAGTDLSATSDGTGAYILKEFVPSESVSYERAPEPNWDPAAGKLAGFTITALNDFQVALNGLQAGQFDMVRLNGLGAQVDRAVQANDYQKIRLPSMYTLPFWLNNEDPALADPRVRQAFSYAIDREGITNGIFDGGAECAPASQMYPFPGDGMYIEGYDPYTYDPDKARSLLEEAGAVGTKLTITDNGGTNTGNLAQAAQPMLEAVGFEVTLVHGTSAMVPAFQRGEIQVAVVPHARQAHPNLALTRYWLSEGPFGLARNEDQAVLDMLAEISDPTLPAEEVEAGYHEIAKYLADLSTLVVVCDSTWDLVADKDIVNVDPRTWLLNMRVVGVRNS